jgi:3-alpha domain
MPALLYARGRPGFYTRVLEEGEVGASDAIERVASGPSAMTVAEVSALLYLPGHTARQLERAIAIPALSEGWRHSFEALLEQDAHSAINESRRNASAEEAADFFRGVLAPAGIRPGLLTTSRRVPGSRPILPARNAHPTAQPEIRRPASRHERGEAVTARTRRGRG